MSLLSRFVLCFLAAVASAILLLPNFGIEKFSNNKINLGLDLKGGVHFLLEVDFNFYLNEQLLNASDAIKKELRKNKFGYKNFRTNNNTISFEMRESDDTNAVQKIVSKSANNFYVELISNDVGKKIISAKMHQETIEELKNKVVEQSIEIIRMRVDSTGTKEPTLQRQGDINILLQIPGEDDPEKLKYIIGKTAKLGFHIVDETVDVRKFFTDGIVQHGKIVLPSQDSSYYLAINSRAEITGDMLSDAHLSFDQYNQPSVSISFNDVGARLFAEATKNNIGKRLAIVLDNKILSAPSINSAITGGSGIISGSFTAESANELALLLRAGALIAPINIVEERTVGPSLGTDSITHGKNASIIGLVSVMIFMMWSYGILGFFANVALCFAMYFIFALLSLFNATLTLPGIAGLILTMGMAVDANVLIYERIREVLKVKGNSIAYSVANGFKSAFATILDSNVTTLIAALFLYIFGTGAIRGFAVTLIVGIIASMFASIIITKMLTDFWLKFFKPKQLVIVRAYN